MATDDFIFGDIQDPSTGTLAADGSQKEKFLAAMLAYRSQGPSVWEPIREYLRRHAPDLLNDLEAKVQS